MRRHWLFQVFKDELMHPVHSFGSQAEPRWSSAAKGLPKGADWRQPPQPLMPVPLRPASR